VSEQEIATTTDMLWRQIHPAFINSGNVSSAAFRVAKKDVDCLSVSWSQKCDPEEAYRRHTIVRQLVSFGVQAVAIGEVQRADTKAFYDPEDLDDAHSFVDFRGLSRSRQELLASTLRDAAVRRGWCFKP